jgi:predicted PilT family ATPase
LTIGCASVQVNVPYDLHRYIIGQKGADVRKMMEKYDVSLSIPSLDEHSDVIRITGPPSNVERAKVGLDERVKQLESEQEDRKLRSFSLEVKVDAKYHPKIIGRKGAVVSKLRDQYGVNIQFPRNDTGDPDLITIVGYEDKANEAREEILKMVGAYESLTEEAVPVDARVHPRIIGQRGRSVRKIMDDFKVEIRFAKPSDPDPNLVFITGDQENVLDAKETILNLEHEFVSFICLEMITTLR